MYIATVYLSISAIKEKLTQKGIDEKDILGARAEGFAEGGNDEISGRH